MVSFKSRRIDDLEIDKRIFKGRGNEDRVEQALNCLRTQGDIEDFFRSQPFDDFDKRGMDFVIWPERGGNRMVALQVKSSITGMEEHVATYGDKIPCLIVGEFDTQTELCEKILEALGFSPTSLEEHIKTSLDKYFKNLPAQT